MLSSLATILCTSLLAGVAVAQAPSTNFTTATIDKVLGEQTLTTLASWCNGQHNSCGILCSGAFDKNTCQASQTNLTYECTCTSNHSAPHLEFYAPTIISFICNTALGDCLATNANDQASQDNCKQTIICGNSSVENFKGVAASSSAASSSAPTSTGGSSGSSASAATGSPSASPTTGAAVALKVGQEYGVGVLSAGLLAIMGLAL